MNKLELRDQVTAIVEAKVADHQRFVEGLLSMYRNPEAVRRSGVLADIKQLRRELLQELDAAIVRFTPEGT